jgi:hypothetical protein
MPTLALRPSILTAGLTPRNRLLELFFDSDCEAAGGQGFPARQTL